MKNLLKIWLVLVLGGIIGALVGQDSGYVLISAGVYTIEMSLVLLILLLCVLFVSLYFVLRLIIRAYRLPVDVSQWRQKRSARLAQDAMTRGLLELSEGQWRKAERRLIKYADRAETPLLNYLSAARAAQLQGAHDRRDAYIRLAHENMPSADVAVSLTQAELQMADHQLEQALATLKHLRSVAPKHTYVLRLLRRLYEQLGDWDNLRELIPELRRRKVEVADELRQLEITTHRALLKKAQQQGDATDLAQTWAGIPKALHMHPEVVADYVGYLQAYQHDADAEKLLHQTLNQGWNTQLVELYGLIECPEPGKHLARLEKFLDEHPSDTVLLLTLGRLSLRAKLWGKARGYLEACVAQENPPLDAYRELGRLLERMGEGDTAMRLYRKALTNDDGRRKIPLPAEIGTTINARAENELPTLTPIPYQA